MSFKNPVPEGKDQPDFQGDGRDQGSRGRSPSQRSGLGHTHDRPVLPSAVTPVWVAPSRPRLSPAAWALIGTVTVSLGLFAWMLVRWHQVARDARRAAAAPAWLGELLPEQQRPARLRLTDRPQSPAVCGLFRPVILLPRVLADHLPPAQLCAMLLHELVHLRRGDVWVNCLQALVQILYWWHPLLWLANARIRRVREEAVDDAVMLAPSEDADNYAPTLLEVAKLSLDRPLASLGLVGILESRSSLRQRIERLLDFRLPRRAGLTLGSALAVVGFAAVAVPMGEARAPSEVPQSTPSLLTTTNLVPDSRSSPSLPAGQQPLYVRTFRVDTNTLIQSLHVGLGPMDTNGPASIVPALLDLFAQAGVDLDPVRNPGKAVFYGDRRGMLMVRSTLHDLDIVEQKLAALGVLHKQNPEVDTLVQDGKLLYEMGELDEAEAKLKLALKEDPQNPAALGYLTLISQAQHPRPTGSQNANIQPESLPVPNPYSRTNLVYTGQGRQAIITRLDRIRLDSVSFNGLPLGEVVQWLADEARKRDPSKSGVNFLVLAAPDGAEDLSSLPITINPPLTNIRSADVLDAVAKVAGRPIKYSLEEYAVVFSAKTGPEPIPLYVRTFKISENTLIEGLHVPMEPVGTNGSRAVFQALLAHLSQAGVDLDPVRNPGKAVFYSDRSGMLLVRGTMQDLDIVEREIAALSGPSKQDADVSTLVHDGKLLYEMDKLDEAEAKLKAAVRNDPHNEAALYYLNLVSAAKYARAEKLHGVLSITNPHPRTNLVYTGQGRQAMINKLDRIRLDSVGYDGMPLGEVVRFLNDEIKKRDPEERGINFLVTTATNGAGDLSSLAITIKPPLTNVRLADVLDAIVKVAGKPIKYSIEDYAVVFSAKTGPELYVRTFKVDPNTMVQGLHLAKGPAEANGSEAVARALRDYFARVGVDLDPTRNPEKALFFNDRQGMLLVRATMQDLDLIEAAIQMLNYVPPQINIECKFVEVSEDDIKVLGIDSWGNVPGNPGPRAPEAGVAHSSSSVPPSAQTTILTEPQFAMVIKALQQRKGAQLVADVEATSSSGRQVQCKATETQNTLTGIKERSSSPPGITSTTNNASAAYLTKPMKFGATLDLVPTVMEDGYTINMPVTATLVELLGYDGPRTNPVARRKVNENVSRSAVWGGQVIGRSQQVKPTSCSPSTRQPGRVTIPMRACQIGQL